MTDETFYIRINGYKDPRYFGPYRSSEWDPQATLREFQSALTPSHKAELLDKLPDLGSNFGKKKRRKFPSPIWRQKKPLVEFDQGNSRWVLDDGEYILLTRGNRTEWEPSIFISQEAANELVNLLLSPKLASAILTSK